MKHILKTTTLIVALITSNACAHAKSYISVQTPEQAHCALLDDFLTEMGPKDFRDRLDTKDIWILVNVCPGILKDLENLENEGF